MRGSQIYSQPERNQATMPVADFLRQQNVVLPQACLEQCDQAQRLACGAMLVRTADLVLREARSVAACSGPRNKAFGRIACGK